MTSDTNLYAPPQAELTPAPNAEQAALELERQRHIDAEASARGLGSLWVFSGGLVGLWAVAHAVMALVTLSNELRTLDRALGDLAFSAVVSVFAGGFVALGLAQRRLEAWTWLPALCLCAAMLIGFPVGTLVGAYYFMLLVRPTGRRVFQPDYPELIRRTPDVRRRTPASVWVALVIALAIAAASIFSAAGP
ncbi:MAG: hypothetical protein H6740_15610 [Alphaproteobacteria bacterium]|nr:hypothetical protein [Alphaproteobacteria bacterium]